MRTTLLAAISALALMSAPALAGGSSSGSAAGGTSGGSTAGAAGQSDTGSMSGSSGGMTGGTTGGSTAAMSEDEIRSVLEAQGYSDVSDLQQQGDMYQAQAMKDGEQVTVMIDPSTGEIQPQE